VPIIYLLKFMKPSTTMNKETLVRNVVVPATIGLAALVLASRLPFSAEGFVGFSTVLAIAGIATLEYRLLGKA
jgi:hypothetical protein